ncbi:aryl-sulfate sulfotransferase [Robiginitalea sp.]|uniref:aryl-sulfate sulfotransferase n=1 Tax=Robiginitalea sp. TaxID=1902411 RepID=UPI003C72FF9C
MTKHFWGLVALSGCISLFSCKKDQKDAVSEASEISEVAVRQWAPEDERSLSGFSATRGITYDSDRDTEGYVLFEPSTSTFTFLIDKAGNVVHRWDSDLNSMDSYLQPNGHLFRLERDENFPTFAAGGQAGRIREYNWDGEIVWDFSYFNEKELIHHDIEIMPNGNILAISYDALTAAEAVKAGKNPELTPKAGIWLDKIIEIKPSGPTGGEIVWEWRMRDHLIQDLNPSMDNFGVVVENPRKINVNSQSSEAGQLMSEEQTEMVNQMIQMGMTTSNATVDNAGADLTHVNAISYNAAQDQIVISVPGFNEAYVIDHSTTTAEAQGSSGGRWGHGGDLLYRWGNPINYGRGTEKDRMLFAQHDVKWIPKGYPGEGNLMVFNNDIHNPESNFPNMWAAMEAAKMPQVTLSIAQMGNYSAVYEWNPPIDTEGHYLLPEDGPFGPSEPEWSYTAPDTYSFYSAFISGAQRLKNGNTLITEGMRGRFFEVTPEKELVWEYWQPYVYDYRLPDGTFAQPVGPFIFHVFRSTLLTPEFPAFTGKNLEPVTPQPEPFKLPPPPSEAGQGH